MNTNQMRQGVSALLLTGALFIGACSTPGTESATAPAATEAAPAPAFVFDVPALIGKNIDQVEQALGKADEMPQPTEEEQSLVGFEWKKTFTKQGYHLLAKYYPDTKQVYAFTLLDTPTTRKGEVRGGLEAVANVKPGATDYYIQLEPEPGYQPAPVDAKANTPPKLPRFVGITIVPASDSTAAPN